MKGARVGANGALADKPALSEAEGPPVAPGEAGGGPSLRPLGYGGSPLRFDKRGGGTANALAFRSRLSVNGTKRARQGGRLNVVRGALKK